MWLNYAFHSKHLLFSQSPLLLVSHLQEDGFLVIIWNAAEFYTKMRLSTWGIHKRFLSLTHQGNTVYPWENWWVSGFYFLVVHLCLFASQTELFTNPVNESVQFTKGRSFHPYIKQFFPFNKDDSSPRWTGTPPSALGQGKIETMSMKGATLATPLLSPMCPALQFNSHGLHVFLSVIAVWQAGSSVKISRMRLFLSVYTIVLMMSTSANHGWLTRYFNLGTSRNRSGWLLWNPNPLSITHFPIHNHKWAGLSFIKALVWGVPRPVLLFWPIRTSSLYFRSGIGPLPSVSCQPHSVKHTLEDRISTSSFSWSNIPKEEKGPGKYRLPLLYQIFRDC